jgi:hypothetical protein
MACSECVMGSLLGPSIVSADFDPGTLAALSVLADGGLLPRLRWHSNRSDRDVTKITQPERNLERGRAKAGAIAK